MAKFTGVELPALGEKLVMTKSEIWARTKRCLFILSLCLGLIADAAAVKEHVLYSFTDTSGGEFPTTLASDAAGNFYGATQWTANFEPGTIFELVKKGSSYEYVVLYAMGQDDGIVSGSLALDAQGNLYGNIGNGGDNFKGSIFELSPSEGGGWTFAVLYSFTGGTDGAYPYGGVILDKAGNLYGTANEGGLLTDCSGAGCGLVFELSPGQGGKWTQTVLHSFAETEGALPSSALVFDPNGNLYGTTTAGGTGKGCAGSPANGCGAVFQLAPSGGDWAETTLHSFTNDGKDGVYGEGVNFYRGRLFGTTSIGGSYEWGTVFELTPTKSGVVETILHSFGSGTDGAQPLGAVVFDKDGNLYGSASEGGNSGTGCNTQGCGAIFQLKPANGNWKETLVHKFTGGDDGAKPYTTPMLIGPALVGFASEGGANGYGVVFALTR